MHARSCNESQCPVPLCSNIKQKLKKHQIEHHIHQDRFTARRMVEMGAYCSGAPTPANITSLSTPSIPHEYGITPGI